MSSSKESKENPKEFYGKVLKLNGIDSEISSIDTQVPTLTGDHFASTIETVTINFKDETLPPLELFVKRIVSNNEHAETLREMQMFGREADYFNFVYKDLVEFCKNKHG